MKWFSKNNIHKKQISTSEYYKLCENGFHDNMIELICVERDKIRRNNLNLKMIISDKNSVYKIKYYNLKLVKCDLDFREGYCEIGDYLYGSLKRIESNAFQHSFTVYENRNQFILVFEKFKCFLVNN